MAKHDVLLTQKIAIHQVHVERAIRGIKSFKILSGRIRFALMSSINQIWFVCSFLTNFMPPCMTQKIAIHQVHVERAIRGIKSFKILSGRIRFALMSSINQIWFVCSFLTNFMPPCMPKD